MEKPNTQQSETTTSYIVDADDFCEDNNGLEILTRIKEKNPAFKITLFTIPAKCGFEFLEKIRKIDWIDMVPHGWLHPHPRECENWDLNECRSYIRRLKFYPMTKGFKAPGWQISDAMYQALLENGYWVADQQYNDARRPSGLKVAHPTAEHYHIGHMGGYNANAIEYFEEYLSNLKGEFKFIKETV